jgi:acetyl esterase/lipase
MNTTKLSLAALAVSALVAACGGGGSAGDGAAFDLSGARGSLVATPTPLATLTPAEFQAAAPATLFQVAGVPKCTITFNYFEYGTVGGAGEKTNATAGIMVPSGADPACQGPRPVLLYGHGTNTNKNMNMASPREPEAALVAAMYAAQGYIVVAPNYAGYDISKLDYHPYLNADQQSKDMIDALTAARKSFASIGASANSKLFVSGYSQGGHVSMATQRALQAAGTPVTAGAHLSGPYALANFGDAVFAGNVNLGATIFTPLLSTSYQRAYGNIYGTVNDLYESQFATGIDKLLPTTLPFNDLFTTGKLPQAFLFAGTATVPQFAPFFGTPNLVKTSYRQAVLADIQANRTAPQHPLRVASKANDLLNFTPNKPMLLCGGNADPTVFFSVNSQGAQAYFAANGAPAPVVTVLDVDSAPTGPTDPFALAKGGFAQAKAATAAAGGAEAVIRNYHGSLVPPFCQAAARGFFSQF